MLPASAGINKLINQIPNVVPNMPTVFRLYILNNAVLNFPRIPRSAMAKEGTIANTRKRILIIQKQSNQNISTCKTCSSKIYCRTKTRYRKNESESSLNNNLAVNSSKTLKYSINFTDPGSFSRSLMSHESRKKNKISITVVTDERKSNTFIQ